MFSKVEELIDDIKHGKMIILLDDENRENEGDVVIAAEMATPEIVNFMTMNARGLICMPLTEEIAVKKNLYLMTDKNTESKHTNFTVSVDYRIGTTTGISAFDRYKTIKALIDERTKPEDLARPGHMFPLIARDGGVLVRAGHTEAAVDLASLAGLIPAGVICEIMNEDGSMARFPD
ncbi:MAG: 3,4-dihydroxy-2-butanone-4-phosphate synthase, partial [Candidatus Delongbacteria bacterium]